MNDTLKSITERLPIDATFTGRTEVLGVRFGCVLGKPVSGHGSPRAFCGITLIRRQDRCVGSEWTVEASQPQPQQLSSNSR